MRDFLIVGAGVIGLSLAWELARRGQSVMVVDGSHGARQTSWVGAGILPPPQIHAIHDPLERMRAEAHELHVQWSRQLLATTGIDNELHRCGGVYLARSKGEATAMRAAMGQLETDGVVVENLSAKELVRLEPELERLGDDIEAAYRLPDEMQVRPPRHLRALREACRQQDVLLRDGCPVTALRCVGDRVEAFHGDERLAADQVCLCAGTWTGQLLEGLNVHLPVEPWRGQMILWKTATPLLSNIVNEGYRYLVPRKDGHLLAGATVEDVGFDDGTTDEAIAELRQFSHGLLPGLRSASVQQTWSALRPGTPDGRPYLDRVPGTANLAVAAGHFRNGLHLSTATAVFMAQLLLDDRPDLDLRAFRLQR